MPTTPNLWSGAAKNIVSALYGDPEKADNLAHAGLYDE